MLKQLDEIYTRHHDVEGETTETLVDASGQELVEFVVLFLQIDQGLSAHEKSQLHDGQRSNATTVFLQLDREKSGICQLQRQALQFLGGKLYVSEDQIGHMHDSPPVPLLHKDVQPVDQCGHGGRELDCTQDHDFHAEDLPLVVPPVRGPGEVDRFGRVDFLLLCRDVQASDPDELQFRLTDIQVALKNTIHHGNRDPQGLPFEQELCTHFYHPVQQDSSHVPLHFAVVI